jgi:hypothetical protein
MTSGYVLCFDFSSFVLLCRKQKGTKNKQETNTFRGSGIYQAFEAIIIDRCDVRDCYDCRRIGTQGTIDSGLRSCSAVTGFAILFFCFVGCFVVMIVNLLSLREGAIDS